MQAQNCKTVFITYILHIFNVGHLLYARLSEKDKHATEEDVSEFGVKKMTCFFHGRNTGVPKYPNIFH
jgi:hypothetical protein